MTLQVLLADTSSPEQIIEHCKEVCEDPDFPTVRRWKEDNPDGKVLGHFQVYFPEEIAHAGGWLPLKIMGAGSRIEARMADSRIASFICSIIRTSLELGLSGRLPFVEAFVTHPICDAARNLAGLWGRNFPGTMAQILYLPQNANSRWAPGYLAGEYRRIARDLEAISGRKITDETLRKSIRVFNANRRLIRQLYQIRREKPWLLSATECYVLVKIGSMMPREQHNELLEKVLALLPQRQARKQDKIRVVFEGGFCEQPPLDMLHAIEENCYVVDDDLLIGMRWILEDLPEEGDPWLELAKGYLSRSSYSPVQHDTDKPKEEMLLKRIRAAGAEAAILAAAKMCEPGLDEQVAYIEALEHEEIPFLVLEFEEKMTTFDQMTLQIETFAESILFD